MWHDGLFQYIVNLIQIWCGMMVCFNTLLTLSLMLYASVVWNDLPLSLNLSPPPRKSKVPSGSSLPLIFCIHVCSGPIYLGVIYLAEKIIRWWYFTCKHVSLFLNPLFYMYIFYKIYLQWIYWTLFFIARCSTIFASDLPKKVPCPPLMTSSRETS
jgi:hypothetical protein